MTTEIAHGPFASLLLKFPDLAQLARALDLPHATVAAWKRRDMIPEKRWRSIEQAAKTLKVKGVTYASLSRASEAKAQGVDGRFEAPRHGSDSTGAGRRRRVHPA